MSEQVRAIKVSPVLGAMALVVWAILAFGHSVGLDLAVALFDWARTPGALHPEGGVHGTNRLEWGLAVCFIALVVVFVGRVAWQLRRVERRQFIAAATPWVLWATMLYLSWACFIIYATELVHFVQYALIGALIALALERGRFPQLALLLAIALGFVDEVWQHYGLHRWLMGDQHHWMDWSDLLLNTLGACGGILPFVTLMRLRGEDDISQFHIVRRFALVAALLLLPLLLLDPVTTSKVLGHYPHYPFWDEHVNDKSVHWLRPEEGIPLFLAAIWILGTIAEPRRRGFTQEGMALMALLLVLAINPQTRREGQVVHEEVASTRVPWIEAGAIVVDGVLDEPAWERAPRLGSFVNDRTGASGLVRYAGEEELLAPLRQTHALLLWDDRALYVAFEVEDGDIWGRQVEGEDRGLEWEEGVQVFVDNDGDEITYYQFVVTPANKLLDVFNFLPAAPMDYNPWGRQMGIVAWDAAGVEVAVEVDGTLDANGWVGTAELDEDRGYRVEIAIPWEIFRTTTTPGLYNIRKTVQPQPGEVWRLGLYRIERPRPDLNAVDVEQKVDGDEVRQVLGVSEERFEKLIERRDLRPGEDGRFRLGDVLIIEARERAEYQAWTPTHTIVFHKPARFGVVEFVKGE